jgi:hypothetical protein
MQPGALAYVLRNVFVTQARAKIGELLGNCGMRCRLRLGLRGGQGLNAHVTLLKNRAL